MNFTPLNASIARKLMDPGEHQSRLAERGERLPTGAAYRIAYDTEEFRWIGWIDASSSDDWVRLPLETSGPISVLDAESEVLEILGTAAPETLDPEDAIESLEPALFAEDGRYWLHVPCCEDRCGGYELALPFSATLEHAFGDYLGEVLGSNPRDRERIECHLRALARVMSFEIVLTLGWVSSEERPAGSCHGCLTDGIRSGLHSVAAGRPYFDVREGSWMVQAKLGIDGADAVVFRLELDDFFAPAGEPERLAAQLVGGGDD